MKVIRKTMILIFALIMTVQFTGCSELLKNTKETVSDSVINPSNESYADGKKDPITGETYPAQINIAVVEGGPESAILIKENYFKGIDVEVNAVTFSTGTDINNAFVSGNVDVSSYGSSPIALGLVNGIKYKAVYVPYIEGGNIEALVVKNNAGVESVKDLKGKIIATPFGTTSHYALINALEVSGLSVQDATLLDMGGQDIIAAWTRGDIQAAYIWSPALDECLKDGKILINDGELAEKGIIIPEIAVARNEFAEKYPTLVSQYVKALMNVYDLTQNNSSQAMKDVEDWEGTTPDNAKGQINDNIWVSGENQLSSEFLGTSENKGKLAETLKTISDFHKEQGNLSNSPELSTFEDAIDPTYVELALGLR